VLLRQAERGLPGLAHRVRARRGPMTGSGVTRLFVVGAWRIAASLIRSYGLPGLGSADCFDDLAGATTVRAGRTVHATAAMTMRADVLARPGSSGCGFIARIERLTGIGCMHPRP
jgi:hypothetical protein